MIKEFQGNKRWLSNFSPVQIVLNKISYPSVEHAYMSAKSNSDEWKIFCSNKNNSPGKVKRASKKIILVENWENIKLNIMAECIKQKFNQEPYKTKLINTGNKHIQEGNRWGDKFWGVCLKTNTGRNELGVLIMNTRKDLKK